MKPTSRIRTPGKGIGAVSDVSRRGGAYLGDRLVWNVYVHQIGTASKDIVAKLKGVGVEFWVYRLLPQRPIVLDVQFSKARTPPPNLMPACADGQGSEARQFGAVLVCSIVVYP